MKILAIRFARLGDVILLLPALSLLKQVFPDAQLTLLTGHRCAPIAKLCPTIDDVLAVDRIAMRDGPILNALKEMTELVRTVRERKFDVVIDFHSFRETNLLTWLSKAGVRIGLKRHNASYLGFCFNRLPVPEDKTLHVGQMFERVVKASLPMVEKQQSSRRPQIQVPDELRAWADCIHPNRSRLVLYIDAPVRERIWPPERFAALADFAVEQLGALPLVISSKQGRDLAKEVERSSEHPTSIGFFTDLSIPQVAALIASSRLLVSNDTGPMHIGPAVGVQTLGLFSVGYPEHFRPLGPNDRFLRASPIEKIETREVIVAVEEMWATVDPGLRC